MRAECTCPPGTLLGMPITPRPDCPTHGTHPPAPEPASGPGAPDPHTERGTGVPGPQIPAQTIDGRPLTGPEIISRTLVLVAGTSRHTRDDLRDIADELDATLRVVHARDAAQRLRDEATTRAASAPDAVAYQRAVGIHEAADLLESITDDPTEGNTE